MRCFRGDPCSAQRPPAAWVTNRATHSLIHADRRFACALIEGMIFRELWDGELWARVGMALLCGGIVGLERQLRGKPAGMRTSSLICIGTSMFVYLGRQLEGDHGDPAR